MNKDIEDLEWKQGLEDSRWDFNKFPKICDKLGRPFIRPMILYLLAKREYYAGKPIMSDYTFDAFEEEIKNRFPDCTALYIVGASKPEDEIALRAWIKERKKS